VGIAEELFKVIHCRVKVKVILLYQACECYIDEDKLFVGVASLSFCLHLLQISIFL